MPYVPLANYDYRKSAMKVVGYLAQLPKIDKHGEMINMSFYT
jgi:hypothetical protein